MVGFAATLVAGCASDSKPAVLDPNRTSVAVGSFDFTESRIVAELYTQVLSKAQIPVRQAGALASREVLEPALEQGIVDLVPEYTGSAIEFLDAGERKATNDPAKNAELLRAAFDPRGVDVLDIAPAQNKNAVAVTSQTATRMNLKRVSDLRAVAGTLVFGGPPECSERPLCLGGLRDVYGLRFRSVKTLDAAGPATVAALESGEVDVGLLFTTSPQVAAKGFVLLEDDLGLQPAENLVPAVRREVRALHGDRLTSALNELSAKLTTEALTAMNRAVELEGQAVRAVARAWLRDNGLA
jgi:osmoprotectant transport system substrate-binding protein